MTLSKFIPTIKILTNYSGKSQQIKTKFINYVSKRRFGKNNNLVNEKINEIPAGSNGSSSKTSVKLMKPLLFTSAFTTECIVIVSIWEFENQSAMRSKKLEWFRYGKINSSQQQQDQQSSKQLLQPNLTSIVNVKKTILQWWESLSPSERIFVPICAMNLCVFALWRIPKFQPFMMKYFCSNPAAKAVCWPMVLSTFSHYSAFHIFANMYVLYSFSDIAVVTLGKEQFLGLYMCAGVISSFASYLFKAGVGIPGMSLGASGAIMGILAYVCAKYPDIELNILFLPMFTFTAGTAIKALVGFDLAGCIMGWKFFDHAAHLGGAAVGLFWCYFGSQEIWSRRNNIQKYWHQLKSK